MISNLNDTVTEIDNKLDDMQEEEEETPDTSATAETPKSSEAQDDTIGSSGDPAMDASFMSESIYEKLPTPSPRSLRHRSIRMDSYYSIAGCFVADKNF